MLTRMRHVAGGASGTALKFAFVVVCCAIGMVFAQSTTATLNGTVTDSSGGSIADAVVVVTNQGNGREVQTRTSSEGTYSLPGLTSGTYKVTVSKTGFATLTQTDLFLGPTVVRTVNSTLAVGQTSQNVTVEAAADQVQTSTGEVSNSVAQVQVETLPLNGRNYQSLSALMPRRVEYGAGPRPGAGWICDRQHHVHKRNGTQRNSLRTRRRVEHEHGKHDADHHPSEPRQYPGSPDSSKQYQPEVHLAGRFGRSRADSQRHARVPRGALGILPEYGPEFTKLL